MNPNEVASNAGLPSTAEFTSVRPNVHRSAKYQKVLDGRKQPIRGLWRRNGRFLARITVEDDSGKNAVKWVPLEAKTASEAQAELRKVLVERSENRLRHIGRCPTFGEYLDETYLRRLRTTGKKPDTLVTETGHLSRWRESIGHLYLDKIRPHHITAHLDRIIERGRSSRTRNLALVCLRSALKSARTDGFIKTLPVDGIDWQQTERKARRLYTREEIEIFCCAAVNTSKNGEQFSDYLHLLTLSGAREQEAIKLRWADVDFDRQLLTIGADADTKNREARHVDFSPDLELHLRDMLRCRAPDSQWLFPSPQRGGRDERAKTFRETLLLARKASGSICRDCNKIAFGSGPVPACPHCQSTRTEFKERVLPVPLQGFGFHDCRHHFISYAVMSGIDFMTIARWAGHKDGGVLIGKVYGRLSNEHARSQAARLSFGPSALAAVATV